MVVRVSRVNGHVRQAGHRQGGGQVALVADGRHRDAGRDGDHGEDDDGDQRRRDHLGDLREEHHERQPADDQRVDQPGHVVQLGHLGHEDQDGQGVDEADHDAARHEPHQLGHPERAEDDLEDARQDDGGDQVAEAVLAVERGDDEGDRAGGGGDHRAAGRRRTR